MRKVTYGGASSLDALFTGPDESIDWLRPSADINAIMTETFKGLETMLMGRKTYEFALRMGGPITMGKIKTYVFSRTLKEVSGGAELVRGDAAGFVRELKAQEGGGILVMGGSEIGSALIEA